MQTLGEKKLQFKIGVPLLPKLQNMIIKSFSELEIYYPNIILKSLFVKQTKIEVNVYKC